MNSNVLAQDEEKSEKETFILFKEKFNKSMPYLKNAFLESLICESLPETAIRETADFFDIDIPLSEDYSCRVILFEVTMKIQGFSYEDKVALTEKCIGGIEEYFRRIGDIVFREMKDRIVVITQRRENGCEAYCKRICEEITTRENCLISIGISKIHYAVYQISTCYREALEALLKCRDSISVNDSCERRLVSDIKRYIADNYSNPDISLSLTAENFSVSTGHLCRILRQQEGTTFMDYLNLIRTKKAVELLKTTELKNYQIGEIIGICDPHYFSIFIKKQLGMSANTYRKNCEP